MTEIIQEILPGHPAGVLTGPNLAGEIMGGQAAASVIAMEDEKIATQIQDVFRSGLFRVYTNNDVIGCDEMVRSYTMRCEEMPRGVPRASRRAQVGERQSASSHPSIRSIHPSQ